MAGHSYNGAVIIVAKCPIPGKSKTRLIPLLGQEGAAKLATAMLSDVLTAVSTAPQLLETRKILLYAPPNAQGLEIMQSLLQQLQLMSWTLLPIMTDSNMLSSNLSAQLTDALLRVRHLLTGVHTADEVQNKNSMNISDTNISNDTVVFLGMDSPELPLDEIQHALNHNANTATLCPSADGGYGMLAVPGIVAENIVFDGMQKHWSTNLAAVAQIKCLTDANIPVRLGRCMYDIDEPIDVHDLIERVRTRAIDELNKNCNDVIISQRSTSNESDSLARSTSPSGADTYNCVYTIAALEKAGLL